MPWLDPKVRCAIGGLQRELLDFKIGGRFFILFERLLFSLLSGRIVFWFDAASPAAGEREQAEHQQQGEHDPCR